MCLCLIPCACVFKSADMFINGKSFAYVDSKDFLCGLNQMRTQIKALCKSIQRGSNVFRVKLVLMGRFVVCVCLIICGSKGGYIFSFLTKIRIIRKRYVHW